MSLTFELSESRLGALTRRPSEALAGSISGTAFRTSVAIADYPGHIRSHYAAAFRDLSLAELIKKSGGAVLQENFGLIVEFSQPVELLVHDEEKNLVPGLRQLITTFGLLMFRNARRAGLARVICRQMAVFSARLQSGSIPVPRYFPA
jgi:hypothetical protein